APRLGPQPAGALVRPGAQRRRSRGLARRGAHLPRQLPLLHRPQFAGRRQAHHARPLRRADARLHDRARRPPRRRRRAPRRPGDGGSPSPTLMLEYFAGHYSWNLGVMMAAQLGGELTEIDSACRPLRPLAEKPKEDPEAQAAWISAWSGLAERLQAFAARDEAAGHLESAGGKYRRACIYWYTAERMTSHKRPEKLTLYDAMVRCFGKSVALRREPIEAVTIPYEGTTLPALFQRAPGGGRRPAMIHFDGFDVTKE